MRQQADLLLLTGGAPPAPVGVGFPMYPFVADGATTYDPGNPNNRDTIAGGVVPVYGGPVGEVKAEATVASTSLRQTIDANRPLLRRVGNRDCLEFDGVNDALWVNLTQTIDFTTPPKAVTLFVSVYLHTAVSGQTGFSLEGSSANTHSRHLLTTSASGCRTGLRFDTTPSASNVIWEDLATLGVWMDLFWELNITSIKVAGVGTGTGTIKSWLNEEAMLSTAIVPDRSSSASAAMFNQLSLGAARAMSGATEWCKCTIGKIGFVRRALTSDERTQIKAWMRSPVYAPPILAAA